MKTCEQFQELVSAYVDGEVTDEETADVFFHLGQCPECRAFMTSLLRLESAMKAHDTPAAILSKKIHLPAWKRTIAIPYPVAAAVAALMLLSGSLLFIQRAQPPEVIHQTQTAYVYVTLLPPVNVVESPLPEKSTN